MSFLSLHGIKPWPDNWERVLLIYVLINISPEHNEGPKAETTGLMAFMLSCCIMSCYREIDEREGDISVEVYNCCLLRHLSETKRIDLYEKIKLRNDFANTPKNLGILVIYSCTQYPRHLRISYLLRQCLYKQPFWVIATGVRTWIDYVSRRMLRPFSCILAIAACRHSKDLLMTFPVDFYVLFIQIRAVHHTVYGVRLYDYSPSTVTGSP